MIDSKTAWRDWAVGAHLMGVLNLVNIPLAAPLGTFIIYLLRKNDGDYVRANAANALNFQLTLAIVHILGVIAIIFAFVATWIPAIAAGSHLIHPALPIASFVLLFALVGLFLLANLASVAYSVIAANAANQGRIFRYAAIHFVH